MGESRQNHRNSGSMERVMDDDFLFIPPIDIPLQRLSVTYRVTFEAFLEAARRAARQLGERQERLPVIWEVDGFNSHALFLIRWQIVEDGPYINPFQKALELDVTTATVTVGVLSRWESDLEFYRAYLWHLDAFLPRKRA